MIFASLVDDPESCPEEFPTEEGQLRERERLHAMISELVKWENTDETNPRAQTLLQEAHYEIARSVARSRGETAPTGPSEVLTYLSGNVPPIFDPFCGGGSIPLEAQRLGLKAIGSDLNPVAVLISRSLIDLPTKFRNQPPVNPEADRMGMTVGKGRKARRVAWRGAAGLADDVRFYGRWMRDEASKRIGPLYPRAELPDGSDATVIAWLWARTVPCPNPACGVPMPLMRTFQLSTKKGNRHWTRPLLDRETQSVSFVVQDHAEGVPTSGTVSGKGAVCLVCQSAVPLTYVRERARAGDLGQQMTAIVAEGKRKRLFLSPNNEHLDAASRVRPRWWPTQPMPDTPTLVSGRGYGITHWHELFTSRQLNAITTFIDILSEWRSTIEQKGVESAYADLIATYLMFALSKLADWSSAYCSWIVGIEGVRDTFARQAIPMVWDYTEINPVSNSVGNFGNHVEWVAEVVKRLPAHVNTGKAYQADAAIGHIQGGPIVATDPPYYDNIDYADLSDFFYIWLRPLLRDTYPDLFAGILTPKADEMVAIPSRFEDPRRRFEDRLGQALARMRESSSSEFPVSIFYAYKQQEELREGRASTGWETMLSAAISAGFQIVGTWPIRTERSARTNALGANALASSVVLVCRPRPTDAPLASCTDHRGVRHG